MSFDMLAFVNMGLPQMLALIDIMWLPRSFVQPTTLFLCLIWGCLASLALAHTTDYSALAHRQQRSFSAGHGIALVLCAANNTVSLLDMGLLGHLGRCPRYRLQRIGNSVVSLLDMGLLGHLGHCPRCRQQRIGS
eukprot:1158371-Pelagomonas_calceolata.AAC.8